MANLQFKALRKSFGDLEILHGIDLEIQDGEFIVFVGPSGCGKSTLLRCIAGLEEISSGELAIGGQPMNEVPPSKRGIAMVFQSYALYPHMTVAENMAFGLKLAGHSKGEIKAAVQKAAEILQIESLLDRRPKALSGGQRQRVAIGRAIVRKPGVFLFDEPLSNLDAGLRVQMRVELARLHKDLATTMVYVTHDQVEAMTLADRIVVINQGQIEQVGAPLELYHHPANRFVAGFIGSPKMNFLPCTLESATEAGARVRLEDGTVIVAGADARGLAEGTALTLGIRPERLLAETEAGEGTARTTVIVSEHLGDTVFLYVQSPGSTGQLTVKAKPENPLRTDDVTYLRFPTKHCLLFGPDSRTLPRLS
ncbi:MAG: sn-glycerol-3-phosphate ABC transporter ATP-binding protein UgpC [Holophagaceae bacterium]|uniref:Sn-glycerol-3-phosphate ABC transporter ATP-binding protein UgpC n=1 Tax=Candidatus Geothrix skivensis TaxID=2954439 RepID=A0A9D7SIS0_9BACT|nr:sn-glycerol-3-phosphate ABC transporter ATP-binding protein UgpC [Candidatus Geothrix skivensis]